MRVIIIGAGQVGYDVAQRLAGEHQDVVVIDKDVGALKHVSDTLDVQPVVGSGSSPKVLLQAGIEEASLLVALTENDEVNMMACMVARAFGGAHAVHVARVRQEEFFEDERLRDQIDLIVDLHINPERVAAAKVSRILSVPAAIDVLTFAEGRVQVVGIPVADDSPIVGRRFADLDSIDPDRRLLVVAISRPPKVIIPRGSDQVCQGDTIYAVVHPNDVEHVVDICGHANEPVRRVMLSGANSLTMQVASLLLEAGVQTKVIAQKKADAYRLAERLEDAVVLEGEPTNEDLLREEFISEMDAYVALGDDEEENILSAILAKRLGVRRTIAVTNKASYLHLIQKVGVDVVISPRQLASSSILQFIRPGRVVEVVTLGSDAEADEFAVDDDAKILGQPLRDVRFPEGSLLGAIVRGEDVIIPSGDSQVQRGDHVVVFSLAQAIPAVEKIFTGKGFR